MKKGKAREGERRDKREASEDSACISNTCKSNKI